MKARLTKIPLTLPLSMLSALLILGCTERQSADPSTIADSVYLKAGNKIIAVTFDTLRSSLLKTIEARGIAGAISFCNTNASGITQSYADTFLINRTALRWRNENNKPDSLELIILRQMSDEFASMKTSRSHLVRTEESIHVFKPIIMQGLCVNCHGKPNEEITQSTLTEISRLYPRDRAVNFKEGDLRGMWHITFKTPDK